MVHGALPLYFVPAPAVVAAPAQRSDRQLVGRAVDCVADQRRRHTNRQSRPTHRRSHKSKLISKSRPTQILLSVVLRDVALTPRSLSLPDLFLPRSITATCPLLLIIEFLMMSSSPMNIFIGPFNAGLPYAALAENLCVGFPLLIQLLHT